MASRKRPSTNDRKTVPKKTKRSDPSPQQRQRSIKEYFSPEKKEDGGDLKNNLSSDVVRTSLSPNPREASANSSVNSSSISTPLSSQSGSDQAATSNLSTNGSCNTSYRRRKRARLSKENRSPTDKLKLTEEQLTIINHDEDNGGVVKIMAFAGTGKTTTLVLYTKAKPDKHFLYVAYNKAAQENAERLFPDNVECKTLHSLAYEKVGSRYKHKLKQLKIRTIMKTLPDVGYPHARTVQETLENFISSADDVVKVEHVPERKYGKDRSHSYSHEYKSDVVSDADKMWELMSSNDKKFPMTHDGYFKIYQLQSPVLTGFDYLLIDEAQDCTPAASAFLLSQKCTKILVGDPHQQIYSFRGARNALQEVESSNTFYLTQSFRFGPEIAYVASSVLKALKDIQEKTLEGVAGEGSVLDEKCSKQLNVITRTNYTLFNEAASVCHAKEDVKVGFIGGIKSLDLDRIHDIWKLRRAGSDTAKVKTLDINDKLIKHFGTFPALEKYARDAPDPELLSKIKIVEMHEENLDEIVQLLKSKAVRKNDSADVIFSTAHKAKGLEFDHVRVAEDFLSGLDSGLYLGELEDDEKNLLYVAVSRAKKSLRLSQKIVSLIHLQKPCVKCKSQVLEELIVSGEGFFCRSCARSNFPYLESLSLEQSAFSRFSAKLNPVGATREDFEDF